ncbi:MAG: DNA-processing protein DprA, partial [Bacteroidota bacterium]|nr:DNA-processing protein DprA [Bacteroidota bacterium]
MSNEIRYAIALSLIPRIGPLVSQKLIAAIGSVDGIFHESAGKLLKIPGIGEALVSRLTSGEVLKKADLEMNFISKNNIKPFFYFNSDYPRRLKMCSDAPLLLYFRGNAEFNQSKVISIVGTRSATAYGRELCVKLLDELHDAGYQVLVVSGLAYGIDSYAHKTSLKNKMPTVGVLGHGLDKLYPPNHGGIAREMIKNGGLLTEFPSGSKIDPKNFVRRNRIIAGLADATIVIESGMKGGSLVTASLASSYNRDIFAFPGRCGDIYSSGCNNLIKNNQAALIESAKDLAFNLGWDEPAVEIKHVE